MSEAGASRGVQGVRSSPLASSGGGTERSEVSDTVTARSVGHPRTSSSGGEARPADAKRRRRGSPHLDVRCDEGTLSALRTRAARLRVEPSAWVRSVVRDALDSRRTEQVDLAVAARMVDVVAAAQPSADVRYLAAQIRPLAINVNDLDRRARRGEAVSLGPDGAELVELLREVRVLFGDRVAS